MASETRAGENREAVATAIGLYALGEVTLGQAAERADVSRFRMRDLLEEAGFEVDVGGPADEDDARRDVDALDGGE